MLSPIRLVMSNFDQDFDSKMVENPLNSQLLELSNFLDKIHWGADTSQRKRRDATGRAAELCVVLSKAAALSKTSRPLV